MYAEWRSKGRAHNIVDPRKVCPVCDVESLRCKSQSAPLAEFEASAQAHVEDGIIGTDAAVARGARGTIIGEMIVAINVRAGQQIKGMAAVVGDNRR